MFRSKVEKRNCCKSWYIQKQLCQLYTCVISC